MAYLIPGSARPLPADSPRDLVFFLMGNTRTHACSSVSSFMVDFAVSFTDFSGGKLLNDDNPDVFVAGLIQAGFLEQV